MLFRLGMFSQKKQTIGQRVVVIGGGAVRVETALMLAEEGTLFGEELEADTVVLAVGTKPYNPLQQAANELGISFRVICGATQPAMVLNAIHHGFAADQSSGRSSSRDCPWSLLLGVLPVVHRNLSDSPASGFHRLVLRY
jgi:hypothetical protein